MAQKDTGNKEYDEDFRRMMAEFDAMRKMYVCWKVAETHCEFA